MKVLPTRPDYCFRSIAPSLATMAVPQAEAGDDGTFKLYRYDPSMGAAVIFIMLFVAVTGLHLYQFVKTKTWFFACFIIGGLSKANLVTALQ